MHNHALISAMQAVDNAEGAWSTALAVYLAAKSAEDAYDRDFYMPAYRHCRAGGCRIPAELEVEIERLQDVRGEAEDALMAIPSPDPVAFSRKFLIAHGEGRNANGWDDMLEAEAKRFVGEAAQ